MAVAPALWEALDTSFGYLNQAGYCAPSKNGTAAAPAAPAAPAAGHKGKPGRGGGAKSPKAPRAPAGEANNPNATVKGACKRFPIAIGEFGSRFTDPEVGLRGWRGVKRPRVSQLASRATHGGC
jgi:hypothetical protein